MHVSLQHSDVDIKTHRETSEVSGANLESRVRHKVRGEGNQRTKIDAVPRNGSKTMLPGLTLAILAIIKEREWSSDLIGAVREGGREREASLRWSNIESLLQIILLDRLAVKDIILGRRGDG
jgi:hypothetical protein